MAIIVLEGPDGSGKSTLADKLSNQLGYPVAKFDKPKTKEEALNQVNMYVNFLETYDDVICDRAWYSDIVYGNIMGDRKGWHVLTSDECKYLDNMLKDKGFIMHCTSDVETLWSRCNERGEEYVDDFSKMLRIKDCYEQLFSNVATTVFRYDARF